MNRKQRWTQRAAFFFMLVTALLIIPAIPLIGATGMLFDAPGSENNVPLVMFAYSCFSLPFFFGVAAYRFLKIVMSPNIKGFVFAIAIGLAPIVCIVMFGYVLWGRN